MKKTVYTIWLLCLLLLPAAAERIALLALDPASRNTADLALAELAGSEEIELLERDQLDLLRKELKLDAAGLLSGAFRLDPEKIRNVDLFVILHTLAEGQSLLLAYDAATGVRLTDIAVSGEQVKALIMDSVEKRRKLRSGLLCKIAVSPVVEHQLSLEEQQLVRRVELLLFRQLAAAPDLLLLERRYLRYLLEEPGLEPDEATRNLLAGSVLVRLYALKSPGGGTLRFLIRTGDGEARELRLEDAALDIQVAALIRELGGSPIQNFDRIQEGLRYRNESRQAFELKLYRNALTLAENAYALNPDLKLFYAESCLRLADRSHWPGDPATREEFGMLRLKLFRTGFDIMCKANQEDFFLHDSFFRQFSFLTREDLMKEPPEFREELRKLAGEYLAMRHADFRKHALPPAGGDRDSLRSFFVNHLRNLERFARVNCQYWDMEYFVRYALPEIRETYRQLEQYREELNALPLAAERDWAAVPREDRLSLRDGFFAALLYRRPFPPEIREPMRQLFQRQRESPSLEIALDAAFGFLLLESGRTAAFDSAGELPDEAVRRFRQRVLEAVKTKSLYDPYPSSWRFEGSDALDADTRLEVARIATERFGMYAFCYDFFGPVRTMTEDEAVRCFHFLAGQLEKLKTDSRLNAKLKEDYSVRIESNLDSIARKFPALIRPRIPLPARPDSPYRTVYPVLASDDSRQLSRAAFDGRYIYFVSFRDQQARLGRVDTEENMALWEGAPADLRGLPFDRGFMGFYDRDVFLTDDHLGIASGDTLLLLPRDGSRPMTRRFPVGFVRRSAGNGDRIFLASDTPGRTGTLLEYRPSNGEIRTLISGVDPTVKWPFTGFEGYSGIRDMKIDPERKRLIVLMNVKPVSRLRNIHCGVLAYFYETGLWEVLALPQEFTVPEFGLEMIPEGDSIYFLFSWATLFRLDLPQQKMELLFAGPLPGRLRNTAGTKELLHKNDLPELLHSVSLRDYRNGVLYADRQIFFLKEKTVFEHNGKSCDMLRHVFDNRYAVIYGHRMEALSIGVLLPPQELKSLSPSP